MRLLGGKGAVVAAIVLGALTSYLAWHYVDQANENKPVETAPVVVAAMPIPARTVVTPDMIRVQQLPLEAVHPAALRTPNDVLGKIVKTPLTADEQVLSTKLFLQRDESGLAFMVPEGMRAVSVGFNEVIGSGGMLLPGDHVDVIGVFDMKEPQAQSQGATATAVPTPTVIPGPIFSHDNQAAFPQPDGSQTTIATTVLEDVPVLAIAQQLEGQDTRDTGARLAQQTGMGGNPNAGNTPNTQVRSDPQPVPQAKTATLAVNPDDALKLALAEDRGKIRLALRRPKGDTALQVASVPNTALTGAASR
jgi:Flp pilus assembly protein CpaB